MAEGPEKKIVNAIKHRLQERGAWVTKTHGSPYSSGLPDLFACYRGRFMGIEVKTPKTLNTVSARQAAILAQIDSAGGFAFVASSVEEVDETLNYINKLLDAS